MQVTSRCVVFLISFLISECFLLHGSVSQESLKFRIYDRNVIFSTSHDADVIPENIKWSWNESKRILTALLVIPTLLLGFNANADDELADYASKGNKVGVDGLCFFRKCALETSGCANNQDCLKGLACLSRCKGASLCSTGCFAKYGSDELDNLLYCSVEKNDCVHVPRTDNSGWVKDKLTDLPVAPMTSFRPSSMRGSWYKIMGLDSRYDCFDCQKNSFSVRDKHTLDMEALFRIPRPTFPGYLQSSIKEELQAPPTHPQYSGELSPHLQSQGKMFGLTFWENWYVLGEHNFNTVDKERNGRGSPDKRPPSPMRAFALGGVGSMSARASDLASAVEMDGDVSVDGDFAAVDASPDSDVGPASSFAATEDQEPDLKLVYYTGHTLQGNYKGAFLYSRSPNVTPRVMAAASRLIRRSGLKPADFCLVRNTCFLSENKDQSTATAAKSSQRDAPFWYIGQRFFQDTETVGKELADWFEDPVILSDWLIKQQQRMILRQPLEVSPFASLSNEFDNK